MNFGFLLFPDVEELDFAGPWEIVAMWSKHCNGPQQRLLIGQTVNPLQCANGMLVTPHCSFADCPPLDYLLIPGGQGTRKEVNNRALLGFVRQQAANCRQVLLVCTGVFILQAAGLLANKQATTYWGSLDRLRQFPDVTVIEERFVRDGNIWTSAGVSAGIDLTLALIADQAGEEIAGKVQLGAEYYPLAVRYGIAHLAPEAPAYLRPGK